MYLHVCSENKGADPLRSNHKAYLHLCFRICKNRFSHDLAQVLETRKTQVCLLQNYLFLFHFIINVINI